MILCSHNLNAILNRKLQHKNPGLFPSFLRGSAGVIKTLILLKLSEPLLTVWTGIVSLAQ